MKRADRLRHHDMPAVVRVAVWWAAVDDWARVARRNVRLQVIAVCEWWQAFVPADVPGIPKCQTCQQGEHRACGWLLEDPACGCYCVAAQQHRRELVTIRKWANA